MKKIKFIVTDSGKGKNINLVLEGMYKDEDPKYSSMLIMLCKKGYIKIK